MEQTQSAQTTFCFETLLLDFEGEWCQKWGQISHSQD